MVYVCNAFKTASGSLSATFNRIPEFREFREFRVPGIRNSLVNRGTVTFYGNEMGLKNLNAWRRATFFIQYWTKSTFLAYQN